MAAILGRSVRQITLWQNQGLPFTSAETRGGQHSYDTAEVIDWIIRREAKGGLDKEEQQAQLLKEQTEIARRRNQVESGELIELEKCIFVVQRIMFAIRQKIVSAPLPMETRQAILVDLQTLKTVDFESVKIGDEEATPVVAEAGADEQHS